MAEEPPGREYDWLHSSSTEPEESPGPEHTQVLPAAAGPPRVHPRDPYAGAPHPQAPRPRAILPRRRRWRRFPVLKVLALLVVAWIAFLVAVPLTAWKSVAQVNAFPSGKRPAEQPGTTYLLVGSDSRHGLTRAENRQFGTGGVGDVGQRTDTIMLLHTGSGPDLLMSIPRDSLVPIPGHGTSKINAAFAWGGPKLLVKTIEQDTGIRIDHYVEIGFGGFVKAVDAVGGITICPTSRMVDPQANLRIKKGCQEVDGITALGYARSRHTSPIGDIDRAKHQREVVSAIGSKVASPWTFLNPFRYKRIVDAGVSTVTVDQDLGITGLARFGWAMTRINDNSGLTCGMPISDLAVHWDRERALRLIRYIKTDRTADIPKKLCNPTGLPQ